jgi:hypothetical protein
MNPLPPLDPDFLRVLNEVIQDQTQAYLQRYKHKQTTPKHPETPAILSITEQ